jgi:hypothetical protein
MAQAYPLHWPQGFARTERPQSSQFRTAVQAALNNVTKSLKQFASDSGKCMTNITVPSNFTLGDQRLKDSGVAVYVIWEGMSIFIAMDRYIKI